MAFSTQREFFHVPFLNEIIEFECRRECVKLKSYESTIDDRSWALKDEIQSRYLSDLVTCRTPVKLLEKKNECSDKEQREGKCYRYDGNNNIKKTKVRAGGADGDGDAPDHTKKNYKTGFNSGHLDYVKSNLKPDDSLIHAANNAFGRLEDLLQEKDDLKSQLASSNNSLNKALKERDELRERLKSFKEMEKRIADLLRKSKEVGRTQQDLTQNLCKQAKCIDQMKAELRRSEDYYEQKLEKLLQSEQRLRRQNCQLKDQLSRFRIDHKRMQCLQKENTTLCYELRKLQEALTECDCQYDQLMRKVCLFKDQGYSFNSGAKTCCFTPSGSCDS